MFRFTVRKFIMLQESVVVPCNQTRLKHCFIVTGAWSHPDLLYFISRSCNKTLRLQGCRTSSEYIQNLLGSYVPTVKETHSFLAGIRVKPYSVANSQPGLSSPAVTNCPYLKKRKQADIHSASSVIISLLLVLPDPAHILGQVSVMPEKWNLTFLVT